MRPKEKVTLEQLPLDKIASVAFFKRDEITSDLICSEVTVIAPSEATLFFHEEMDGWDGLLAHLDKLPGFQTDWYGRVVQPPFCENRTVAYRTS